MGEKAAFELGSIPPLGVVPERMLAATIREERYGEPAQAFAIEEIPVPAMGPNQVLVQVMAAGVNYNNIWASLGAPLDVVASHRRRGGPDYHVGGSDASGVVWATGADVKGLRVGDAVVVSGCQWDERAEDIRLGADPMTSTTQRVWGYEVNFGSFAQFTPVDEYQCHPKPPQLSWEQAACYMGTGATAYRQLMGWPPHVVRPGDPVLIWGGAGGLGSMAIQITRVFGGIPVAVVSDKGKFDHCLKLGAHGVIDRTEFHHWGRAPNPDDGEAVANWMQGARAFGKRFWEILGERRNPSIVLEHPGEDTIPTSIYVCDTAGMVVVCGGTSGYSADVDLRFLWMRQKRLQGSHVANREQCARFTRLVADGRVDPCLSYVAPLEEVGAVHQMMRDNRHPPGNMAVLVNSPRTGLRELA